MVSIIIPCFNCEKTILTTLESVYHQDNNNYEIIAINDGSTDNTLSILKSEAEHHNELTILTGPNKGVSHARNLGIEKAKGNYLYFLDSDDTITSSLVNNILTNAPFDLFYFSYEKKFNGRSQSFIAGGSNNPLMDYLRGRLMINMCSIVFNSIFIKENNIHFDETLYYSEDRKFIIESLINARQVKHTSYIGFIYNLHEDSAMSQKKLTMKRLSSLKALEDCYLRLKDTIYSKQMLAYFKASIYLIQKMTKHTQDYDLDAKAELDLISSRYCGKKIGLQLNKYSLYSFINDLLYIVSGNK